MITQIKLACGCVPGINLCSEGKKLIEEAETAFNNTQRSVSDSSRDKYRQAQDRLHQHLKGERKSNITLNEESKI